MFIRFFENIAAHFLCFALHLGSSGSFPPPLSAAEETRRLQEKAQGSEEARRVLIEHNLRLVAHIIKKYYSSYADQEDLISIGTIGLIKAINTFDSSKGTRLATYGARCIENEILMYFRNQKKTAQNISMNDVIVSKNHTSLKHKCFKLVFPFQTANNWNILRIGQ